MAILQKLRARARIPIDLARDLQHSAHDLNNTVHDLNNKVHDLGNKMDAIVEGLANESRLVNDKSQAIIEGLDNQSKMLNTKLDAVITALDDQSRALNTRNNQSRSLSRQLDLSYRCARSTFTFPASEFSEQKSIQFTRRVRCRGADC